MSRAKKPMPSKRSVGAPSYYRPDEHPAAARLMAANGKGLAEMAEAFNVNRHTVGEWRAKHPEFAAAIELGKEDAIDRVERALWARAVGYSHKAVKILAVSGGQGQGSTIETVPYVEHYPPDTEAAKYFLKNRRPADWRDKQEVEHSGPGGGPLEVALGQLSVEDLEKLARDRVDQA